jgi:hypothetical protein
MERRRDSQKPTVQAVAGHGLEAPLTGRPPSDGGSTTENTPLEERAHVHAQLKLSKARSIENPTDGAKSGSVVTVSIVPKLYNWMGLQLKPGSASDVLVMYWKLHGAC